MVLAKAAQWGRWEDRGAPSHATQIVGRHSSQGQYDALDRLTNRVDAVGTTRFSYNVASLPEAEDGPWADDTVSYSYTQRRLTN